MSLWAATAMAISLGLSIYVHLFRRVQESYPFQPVPVYPYRRPNSYMNFGSVHEDGEDQGARSILTNSQLVLQIDNRDPMRKMREDHRGHWTEQGSVYPEDRHFIVNSFVSSPFARLLGRGSSLTCPRRLPSSSSECQIGAWRTAL